MLQVVNSTPLAATLTVFPNPQGVECAYANVKATFDFRSGTPVLAQAQTTFLPTDVYWGEPGETPLRAAADLGLPKPSTDIIILGHAVSSRGPVPQMDIGIQVGALRRHLRVFGDRQWLSRGRGKWAISEAAYFERMPLRWDLAYGGVSAPVEGQQQERDPRNPLGRGFIARHELESQDFAGRPLPNIEDPAMLIASPQDRPAPAGTAPVTPAWQTRSQYAGTYDEAWQSGRAPHLPLDFDPRFLNVAAPGLIAPGYLQGGEEVFINGCSQGKPLHFPLPQPDLQLEWSFDGQIIPARPVLDTVLFETDLGRLQMVWRAELVVDKKLLRLKSLGVQAATHLTAGESVA